MFDDRFNEAFASVRDNSKVGTEENGQVKSDNTSVPVSRKTVKQVEPDGSINVVTESDSTESYDPYVPKNRKEKAQYKSKLTLDDRQKIVDANSKLKDTRAKRDNLIEKYKEELKAKRAKAKENKHGREEVDLLNLSGTDTDIYLDGIIGNRMGFDATGKRTSKATGKELRRVVKKGDKYIFSDDGSEAELFDYQQWKNGKRDGEKFEGKGIEDRALSKALQNIAYKKVLVDLSSKGLSDGDFSKLADMLKTKNKKLSSMLGDGDVEYTIAEQNFIDKLYTPIIENGEQTTQNRRIFADAWDLAETKAIGDIEQALSRLAVADASEDARYWNALKREDEKAFDKYLKEQAGPKPRTATMYHDISSDFPYGYSVSGEGGHAQYMGRVEEDTDGNKYFRVYSATTQPDSVKAKVKEETGGRLGSKDAFWLASHTADTHEKPVYNMPIVEDDNIAQIAKAAGAVLEQYTSQMEGRRNSAPINKAANDWLGETYIGATFPEYLAAEFGEDVKDKVRFNRDRLRKRLEQLEQYNLVVDSKTLKIVPLGSVEDDYLSKLRAADKAKSDLRKSIPFSEQGYKQQDDGTWLKRYKADNPMSKGNRQKGDFDVKRNYGAGSTVKDKKTGKYFGETAQQERLKSLNKKSDEKQYGLLGTLSRRKH